MADNKYISQVITGVANQESQKYTIVGLPQNQAVIINGVYLLEVTATPTNYAIVNIYHNLQQNVNFDYRALLQSAGAAATRSDNYIELNLPMAPGDQLSFSVVSGSNPVTMLFIVDYMLASA